MIPVGKLGHCSSKEWDIDENTKGKKINCQHLMEFKPLVNTKVNNITMCSQLDDLLLLLLRLFSKTFTAPLFFF